MMQPNISHMKSIFLTISVLMLLLNSFPVNMAQGQAGTQVSVEPSDQTVGQPSLPLPTPPFSINITVNDVNDLSGWQAVLYYNSSILIYNSSAFPSGNVFDGKQYSPLGPTLDSDSKGTYLIIGAVLLSGTTFSGSGTLCQIKFIGQAKGTSFLKLDIITDPPPGGPVGYYTNLLNSELNEISISIANGQVTVVSEVQKPPSSITISVDHSSAPLGSNVTISGDINVTRSGVVTISYRSSGSATWYELTRVGTDAVGRYVYSWNTTGAGIKVYELKASWPGDTEYEGAESGTVMVTITKKTTTISVTVHPTNVTAGSSVEISGAITPNPTSSTRPGVTISFRPVGGNWAVLQPELQPVQTDLNGNYTFIWTTSTEGSYELKASWSGDENYEGAESITKAAQVTPAPPFDIMAYLPYIIAVIAVVAIVGIAVYFIKFRKR